mgnify:CR=1 FL=1
MIKNVWAIKLRRLALNRSDRTEFIFLILSVKRDERDVVAELIHSDFRDPKWWVENLIIGVEHMGMVATDLTVPELPASL